MKILLVSQYGDWFDGALRMQAEGHEVLLWIGDKKYWDIGDGLVNKVRGQWQTKMNWADLIVFDNIGFGKYEKMLRENGKVIVGCSKKGEDLEKERKKAHDLMVSVGMKVPKCWEFKTIDETIAFIQKHPARYVCKPNDQGESYLSYCGKMEDGSDIISFLTHHKEKNKHDIAKDGLELEEFQEGIEVAIGAYCAGSGLIPPFEINFEHKKLMNDNIGPSTGEMGTSMILLNKAGKLEKEIRKLDKYLKEIKYVGDFDINFIVNEKGAYALEFTPRFGYPAILIHTELLNGGWGDFLYKLGTGAIKQAPFRTEFAVGVVVCVYPFPYEADEEFKEKNEGMPILGLEKEKMPHVHLNHVKEANDEIVLAGSMGWAMCITGAGETMKKAKNAAYKNLEGIILPDMEYRTDISDRWSKDLPKLQEWGYL
jgi:phosphoribosylamine---glycine ligase